LGAGERESDHGRASGTAPRSFVSSSRDQSEALLILDHDGSRHPWVTSTGGYGKALWTLETEDIDWVTAGGAGVSLDFQVPVHTLDDVCAACGELSDLDWLTHATAWTVHQNVLSWAGIGRESMMMALAERSRRYGALESFHHTEVLIATDRCPAEPGFFRPRTEKSVEYVHLSEPIKVHPLSWIVEHEAEDVRHPFWVRGITFVNPLADRDDRLPVRLDSTPTPS